jgi:hypothetical protein
MERTRLPINGSGFGPGGSLARFREARVRKARTTKAAAKRPEMYWNKEAPISG